MSSPVNRRLTILAVAIGLSVAIAAGWWSRSWLVHAPGKLVIAPAQLEVNAEDGQPQTVSVQLRNEGVGDLLITKVATTCGCSLPEKLAKNRIPPGRSLDLPIRLQAPGYGVKESSIDITTNSPETPVVRLPITVQGRKLSPPHTYGEPAELREELRPGREFAGEFELWTVEPASDAPWLTGFEAGAATVTCGVPEILESDPMGEGVLRRRYKVTVNAAAPAESPARLDTMLSAITRTPATRPPQSIRLHLSWRTALRVSPEALFVSRSQRARQEVITRTVVLVDAERSDWEVVSVSTDADWLQARVLEAPQRAREPAASSSGSSDDASEAVEPAAEPAGRAAESADGDPENGGLENEDLPDSSVEHVPLRVEVQVLNPAESRGEQRTGVVTILTSHPDVPTIAIDVVCEATSELAQASE